MTAAPVTVHRATPRGDARLRPSVLAVLVLLCAGTVVLGVWGALRWSLIPEQLDGTIAWSAPAKDGPPWRDLVLEGGAIKTIDTDLLDRMGPNDTIHGQHIAKDPWARTLTVGGRPVALTPSTQFWRTTATFAVLVTVALVRLLLRFRRDRRDRQDRRPADAGPAGASG